MAEFGMAIIDGADAGVCLDQLCQVSDISNEAECKGFYPEITDGCKRAENF